ncbi:MAG: glycine-rich domain-containing protein-like [Candidatus Obscuribacterales bacterium]|nr:glycine-rich domain-containing protein-like [Candidatus Obscuribacterales bacterium]
MTITLTNTTAHAAELSELWERIQSFEIDDPTAEEPFSAVLREEMDWDNNFIALAIEEYKRFMLLTKLYPDRMVPSVHVDTVWHLHLLYTRNYHLFCKNALSSDFVHHEPSKGGNEEDSFFAGLYDDTLSRYQDVFARIPPEEIWGSRT